MLWQSKRKDYSACEKEAIHIVTGVEFEEDEEEDKVDMCEGIKGIIEDATNEGLQQTAMRMLKKGRFSYEEIAELTSLSLDKVQALAVRMAKSN